MRKRKWSENDVVNDNLDYWSTWDEIYMWGALLLGVVAIVGGLMLPFGHLTEAPRFLSWLGYYMPVRLVTWIQCVIALAFGIAGMWAFFVGWKRKSERASSWQEQKPNSTK